MNCIWWTVLYIQWIIWCTLIALTSLLYTNNQKFWLLLTCLAYLSMCPTLHLILLYFYLCMNKVVHFPIVHAAGRHGESSCSWFCGKQCRFSLFPLWWSLVYLAKMCKLFIYYNLLIIIIIIIYICIRKRFYSSHLASLQIAAQSLDEFREVK